LKRVISEENAIVKDADAFTDMSIAARGLFALEYMLFDAAFDTYAAQDYSCALVQAITHDLARTGAEIEAGWTQDGGYADLLRSAGRPGNERYYTEAEATQTLYTMLTTGLENTALARIGRPLGSFTKPRPRLAEAHRSERSLRNIILSIEAARDLTLALAPQEPTASLAAFDDLLEKAQALNDPKLASVSDPAARLKIEIVQQRITAVLGYIANDVGLPLEISAGFNASDGD
jgi:predicted lipoprotein